MARRVSPAQLRAALQQAQQRQRQAIDKYNREAQQYNRNLTSAINKYNQRVQAHNSRVRAHQNRLRAALSQMSQRVSNVRFVAYHTSVQSMYDSYARLEAVAEGEGLDASYDAILDLAEREMANSVGLANALENPSAPVDAVLPEDVGLSDALLAVSPDLGARWRGAVFALNPRNPDAARHFCTSAREIVVQIIEKYAPDADVRRELPGCECTEQGKPTRRAKLGFLLARRGRREPTLVDFAEKNVSNILELFRTFNDGTHGSAGAFTLQQLGQIRSRVEDGVRFLAAISGV